MVEDLAAEWGVSLSSDLRCIGVFGRRRFSRVWLPETRSSTPPKLVELVKARVLGGGRFAAEKPRAA